MAGRAKQPSVDDVDHARLCERIRDSRKSQERPRELRREIVRHIGGPNWGNNDGAERVPLNLAAMYDRIMSSLLVPANPQCLMSTFDQRSRDMVLAAEKEINRELVREESGSIYRTLVKDALAGFGIAKTCLQTAADSYLGNWSVSAGEAYLKRIDHDDFVYDHRAKSFDQCAYLGHRYRALLSWAKNRAKSLGKDLQADEPTDYNETGDEKIDVMGRGQFGTTEDLDDMVTLWEIWDAKRGKIYTYRDLAGSGPEPVEKGRNKVPLWEQDWIGPRVPTGPYDFLYFQEVTGNLPPKGPLQDLIDLHIETNANLRKATRESRDFKSVTLVDRNAAEGDGQRVKTSSDGDMVPVDDVKNFARLEMNGASQLVTGMVMMLKEMFSWNAGGLDAIAGLGQQAGTLGQEKLIHEQAGRQVVDMQNNVELFLSRTLRKRAWYKWHHPEKTITHIYEAVPNAMIQDVQEYTPEDRMQGNFDEFDVMLDSYSLVSSSPSEKNAQLDQLVQQVIIPMAPVLQQQGILFDAQAYMQLKAKYLNNADFTKILSITSPPPMEPEAGPAQPSAPGSPPSMDGPAPSESEATAGGQARNMMAQLLTGNSQGGNPAEGNAA